MNLTHKIIQESDKYGAHNYHPLPVVLEKGLGVWVWDVEGKKYMDMLSAYSALNQGHNHPKIVQAAKDQLDRVALTSRAFHHDKMAPFLKKLAQITGKEKILPMNSGAEAVETALKAVRKWGYLKKRVPDGKAEIIVCEGNFHGRTTTIVGFSTEEQYKNGFGPFTPGFKVIPYGNGKALEKAVTPNTVAFLVEPIQGEAGVVMPPAGFLSESYEFCKSRNVLFVADEIQTGFGRTGKMFCCDHEEVRPDLYIMGKALGAGLVPVSAVACNNDIMDVFTPGDHGSTFGGNPVACAVAMAALDVIVEERLCEKSLEMGAYFVQKLRKMNSPHVDHVRGKGLLIGVVVKDASGPARPFCEKLMEEGILAKETHHQVIRFAPPLVITKEGIDWACQRIAKVLGGKAS
jgi:ornithine--oxo-acid transaminase